MFGKLYSYVWIPKNTKEKKNVKKNDFLIFSFIMENTKETQNIIKISKKLIYF